MTVWPVGVPRVLPGLQGVDGPERQVDVPPPPVHGLRRQEGRLLLQVHFRTAH